MKTCPPCNGDCAQGDTCPAWVTHEPRLTRRSAWSLVLAALVLDALAIGAALWLAGVFR